MAQTRHPHSGPDDGGQPMPPAEGAAAEIAMEIVREVIESGALQMEPPAPPPAWASQIEVIVERQVSELSSLGAHQQGVLADLLRLHLSLAGPQSLLESGSNFSRPLYPQQGFTGR